MASAIQAVFTRGVFRVYLNDDVIGCEMGGALKNIIAIAAGIGEGLGVGDNTRAAVISRGLAELTRLGVAMGAQPATFAGLAGMGDLIATCMSPYSRNRAVGEQLGKGRRLEDIMGEMHMVAEGVHTANRGTRTGGATPSRAADLHHDQQNRRWRDSATGCLPGPDLAGPRARPVLSPLSCV